jgi:hypothetical protein
MMTMIKRSRLCDQDMIVWWGWNAAITAVSSLPIKKQDYLVEKQTKSIEKEAPKQVIGKDGEQTYRQNGETELYLHIPHPTFAFISTQTS